MNLGRHDMLPVVFNNYIVRKPAGRAGDLVYPYNRARNACVHGAAETACDIAYQLALQHPVADFDSRAAHNAHVLRQGY